MSEEAMITIPAAKLRKIHEDADVMSKNYQRSLQNQLEIINRLQLDVGNLQGYQLIASVLLDRLFDEDDLESISIEQKELAATNPGVWKMEEVQGGDYYVIHRHQTLDAEASEAPPEEPYEDDDEGSDQYNVGE